MASSQPALTLDSRAYGGLGRRLGAYLVDVVIAFSLLLLVGITFRIFRALGLWGTVAAQQLAQGTPAWAPEEAWKALSVGAKLAIVVAFILSEGAIYRVLLEASAWQATFGKRLLNIHVTDESGRRISLARSFGRWLARYSFSLF